MLQPENPTANLQGNALTRNVRDQTLTGIDGINQPARELFHEEAAEHEQAQRLAKLAGAATTILECIGDKPDREGLLKTPDRYAKALLFFTEGYGQDLRTVVNEAVFHEDCDEMVAVTNIDIFSLCEHHLVPFFGKIHIAYVPSHKVIGLSKLARIAEMFARRLQVQERLTKEVAQAIDHTLQPQGVGVIVEAQHFCMMMRGVEKIGAVTVTSCMLGCMKEKKEYRDAFMNLINRK